MQLTVDIHRRVRGPLKWIGAEEIDAKLDDLDLCAALDAAFQNLPLTLPRQSLPLDAKSGAVLLIMCAARPKGLIGVKVVRTEADRLTGKICYSYFVFDAQSGEPTCGRQGPQAGGCRRRPAGGRTRP